MRILVIGIDKEVARPDSGSARRQAAYFVGHQTDILVVATGASGTHELSTDVCTHVSGGSNKLIAFLKTLVLLVRLSRRDYDIVGAQDALFSGVCAWIFARAKGIPYVVQLHGDYLDNPLWAHLSFGNRVMNAIGKRVVQSADGVRCVSQRICRQVANQFGKPLDRTMSLPICTDLSIFSPRGSQHDGGPYVLFVGRLIDEKSPFLFCDAMIPLLQEKPELKVVLIGEGNRREEMQKRFVEAGVGERARFTGQLSAHEVAAWYRSAVCLLHTAAWEGWGMPMIESMACGCPVVTTDTGCAGEAVRDGENGIVTKVDDVEGMRAGVKHLLEQPDLAARFRQASIQEAEKWSFAARVGDQAAFYEHIARQCKDSRHRSRGAGGNPSA